MTALIPVASKAPLIVSTAPGLRLYSEQQLRTWAQGIKVGDLVKVIDKRKLTVDAARNELAAAGNFAPTDAQIEVYRMCAWTDHGIEPVHAMQPVWHSQCAQIIDGTIFTTRWSRRVHEARTTPYSSKAQLSPPDHDYQTQMQLADLTAFVRKAANFAGKGKALDARAFAVMREAIEEIERLS